MTDDDHISLARVGVIDVGSNSVRLVVFDGAARSPAYFYNEKVMCRLGQGLLKTGVLNPVGRQSALATIRRFKILADQMQLQSLRAVATAAVREASDGPDFCAQVLAETGIELPAISGEQEARLAAKGVLIGWPDASGLVCDMGGSSMELALLNDGEITAETTTSLGPLNVIDLSDDPIERDQMIAEQLNAGTKEFPKTQENLYVVGGSLRALAKYHMYISNYPLHVLHDYVLDAAELRRTISLLQTEDLEAVQQNTDISAGRMSLLPEAVRVLAQVLDRFDIKRVIFSSYGLREGMLFEHMPQSLQARDPLIEACKALEAQNARFPGFGVHLSDWVSPLFADAGAARRRLILAACLLHDVHWDAHPDYRAEICFDGAMHSNLGGIGHHGRVFVAWALLHRYASKRMPVNYQRMEGLLSDEDKAQAQALGKAMRLGSMLSGSNQTHLGQLRVSETDLELVLPARSKAILNEVVQKRFESLAAKLCLHPIVSFAS